MSYVRFGNDSDVYIFHSISGHLECCGCKRGSKRFGVSTSLFRRKSRAQIEREYNEHLSGLYFGTIPKWKQRMNSRRYNLETFRKFKIGELHPRFYTTHSRQEMIEHLEKHRSVGDKVPDYPFERLKREIAEKGDRV